MNNSNFKVGDIVTAVETWEGSTTAGKDYVVESFWHNGVGVIADCGVHANYFYSRFKLKEDNKMTSKFVETTRKIKKVINGNLSNLALISVEPLDTDRIRLIVGSDYDNYRSSVFSKRALKELITELESVYEAMED